MKILWVLENYHPLIGGVETLFKGLQERLCQQGHQLIILTGNPGPSIPQKEEGKNYQIIRMPFRDRYLFTFFAFPWVWWYARKVDLVHTTSYNAGLPAFIGAKLRGKKIMITFHEAWGKLWFQLPFISKPAKYLHFAFEQLLLKLPFDRFIAVSNSTATRLKEEGIQPHKIKMIYNGIDYEEFEEDAISSQFLVPSMDNQEPSLAFTFTYFGRLGISKGLNLLLPAAKQLHGQKTDWKLQLIIPREPKNMLKWVEEYVKKHDMGSYVHLRHSLDWEALKHAIRTSDSVVIPSYSEGFCFVAVETMALGIPIISSGRGALAEVVGGKMLKIKHLDAASITEVMQQAMEGKWDERPSRKFEIAPQIQAYIDLYTELKNS